MGETETPVVEKENERSFWLERVVRKQPGIVRGAYEYAVNEAIRAAYLPQKENLPPAVYMEDVKRKLLDEFASKMGSYERGGLIPAGYDKKLFELCLKVWVDFVDFRQLIDASLSHGKEYPVRMVTEWKPDSNYLVNLAKYLYEGGELVQKAFFLGNERGKLFQENEIGEIKRVLEILALETV